MSNHRDPDIEVLIAESSCDEIDRATASIQARLRHGDPRLALELEGLARGRFPDPRVRSDERSLALQALAGARIDALSGMVFRLVADLCFDRNEWVARGAIASAAHLPPEKRAELRPIVERAAKIGPPNVRKAAEAFLAVTLPKETKREGLLSRLPRAIRDMFDV